LDANGAMGMHPGKQTMETTKEKDRTTGAAFASICNTITLTLPDIILRLLHDQHNSIACTYPIAISVPGHENVSSHWTGPPLQ
jgi:LDH2 family malate/lactate/ureidoglycolate dehydrogenase